MMREAALPPDWTTMPGGVVQGWRAAVGRELDARQGYHNGYEIRRTLAEYIEELQGLRHFLDHVRQTGHPRLLDIGSGQARAIRQLAEHPLGRGIVAEATGLLQPSEPLGITHHHTGAESLRGVRTAAYGGILAVYSLMYSYDGEERVASSIDRVLAPGGALKALFPQRGTPVHTLTAVQLGRQLATRGYDVDVDGPYTDTLVAIKRGGPSGYSAQRLYQLDANQQLYAADAQAARDYAYPPSL